MKAGIIGYGGMAQHHEKCLKAAGFDLVGICDTREDRLKLAEEKGIKAYASLEDFLAEEIDVVAITTPHATHKYLAVAAAEAKKHVVVEKPMCMTVAEADAMISAAEANSVKLTVFHNRRWDPDYLTVCKIVKSGILGDIFSAMSRWIGSGTEGGWRRKAEHGGHLYDIGAHLVDQILHLYGKPERIDGFSKATGRVADEGTIDIFRIDLFYQNLIAVVQGNMLTRVSLPKYYVLGTQGSAVREATWEIKVYTEMGDVKGAFEAEIAEVEENIFYKNLRDVLVDGAELAVKPEEAREVVRVLETVRNNLI